MTIQDWGAIGELIGAVAVVVSLVYLAVQIRQNTAQISHSIEASRVAALERNVVAANRLRELIILHPEVADLLLEGLKGFRALGERERLRFEFLVRNILAEFQGAYIRHVSTSNDPAHLAGMAATLDRMLESPGFRECIAEREFDWRPEFQAFVDERMAAADGRSDGSADG
ncbi:MAG: hypothetical protein R3176_09675 [Woeseiaceae bacterium]|nr:hypothetical protein [Woeseiaceae bacterium]